MPKNICGACDKLVEAIDEIRAYLDYAENVIKTVRSMGQRMEDALRYKNDQIDSLKYEIKKLEEEKYDGDLGKLPE